MLHLEDRLTPKGDLRPRQTRIADQTVSSCLSSVSQSWDYTYGSCWHQTAVTASETPSAYHTHVDDFCQLIDQAQQLNHAINFHSRDNTLLRFYKPQDRVQEAVREVETITLQKLLRRHDNSEVVVVMQACSSDAQKIAKMAGCRKGATEMKRTEEQEWAVVPTNGAAQILIS